MRFVRGHTAILLKHSVATLWPIAAVVFAVFALSHIRLVRQYDFATLEHTTICTAFGWELHREVETSGFQGELQRLGLQLPSKVGTLDDRWFLSQRRCAYTMMSRKVVEQVSLFSRFRVENTPDDARVQQLTDFYTSLGF